MSLKTSQKSINSQKVKAFRQFLSKNRKGLFYEKSLNSELSKLKDLLIALENDDWDKIAKVASAKFSRMTEEVRTFLLMSPEEMAFFGEYKKNNPKNPWVYFEEYQKKIQKEFHGSKLPTAK